MNITNLPLKGTSDWFPDEFQIRKYIFDVWRAVCTRFGYQEYLTPLLESADLYRAKSGEDVGGVELTTLTDRGGRELAIRPEMTPSVTRLVSRIYTNAPKPIRLFSIANFYRNENPQRGRNREFWQLNFDIFGSNSLSADFEILNLALNIMLAFKPPIGSFTIKINSRKLIESAFEDIPTEKMTSVFRILDKLEKLDSSEIIKRLTDIEISSETAQKLLEFMHQDVTSDPDINYILSEFNSLGLSDYIKFSPSVLRGFDYYDEIVFEVFDNHPDNKRAMFGGGRYNGLAAIFGINSFPAVGCAPGDETTKLFLESWNLLPKLQTPVYYIPILEDSLKSLTLKIASSLRTRGLCVQTGLETQTLSKAFEYANKQNLTHLVILGENEIKNHQIAFKDLSTSVQQTFPLSDFVTT